MDRRLESMEISQNQRLDDIRQEFRQQNKEILAVLSMNQGHPSNTTNDPNAGILGSAGPARNLRLTNLDHPRSRSVKLEFPRFGSGDPLDWIYAAERYFQYFHIPDSERLLLVSFNLDSPASCWFRSQYQAGPYPDWTTFVAALQQRFRPSEFEDSASALFKPQQTEENILSPSLQLMHGSHLKALIEGTTDTETWTYAILWRSSSSSSSNRSLLNFDHGHYNPKASSCKCLPKQVSIFGSPVTVTVTDEGVVSDEEWFFKISMDQSFADTEDLPGHAFFNSSPVWVTGTDQLLASTWQRTKWGHSFGIRTFVVIPSENGVLELGSTELILCNTARLDAMFGFLVRTRLLGHLPLQHLREQIRLRTLKAGLKK
ncbi:transcription factor MYC2-like isoform X2 [Gastrolobium bilobum]|uniref:transcription factor MYC2-like isoform X2 n=1 Tax=Gastrolobium bilobum TaxID=150636 RepID=UPI002AB2034F|nr:transcription factor MYC2-like isoform X2 [Gastrolobium bilobum]